MTNRRSYNWPDWALTAYVLGELPDEQMNAIRTAETTDEELAREIQEIRSTTNALGELYQQELSEIQATRLNPAPAGRGAVTDMTAQRNALASPDIGSDVPSPLGWKIGFFIAGLAALLLFALWLPTQSGRQSQASKSTTGALGGKDSIDLSGRRDMADTEEQILSTPAPAMPMNSAVPARASVNESFQTSVASLDNRPAASAVELSTTAAPGGDQYGLTGSQSSVQQELADTPDNKPDTPYPTDRFSEAKQALSETKQRESELLEQLVDEVADAIPFFEPQQSGNSESRGRNRSVQSRTDFELGSSLKSTESSLDIGQNESMALGRETILDKRLRRFDSQASIHPSTDRYEPIQENEFLTVKEQPLSTFSVDVDSASYIKTRQFLLQSNQLPPANAVRTEDFINYFEYEYAGPVGEDPFAAQIASGACPWQPEHQLVRIGLQATKADIKNRPSANIVFLLDVSGSMNEPNKLPLVKEALRIMVRQLGESDRIAMVVYAGAAGCILESTRGDQQETILGALDRLQAGGSTNGGQGIQLAYDIARDHFIPNGINRVILCTDGDFNVGVTNTEALVELVTRNAKSRVFLTVLGFGMGNTNDAMMEQISNRGNGLYGFVDNSMEAERQMRYQLAGNLITVAKDVKIQVEFNPQRVASYRLIGYENRKLANEDFANDQKDAGEIGAGHRVTALYEIVPVTTSGSNDANKRLRYAPAQPAAPVQAALPVNNLKEEMLTVSLRYKQPQGDTSKLLEFPFKDAPEGIGNNDRDFQWAALMAQFSMLLRNSRHKGQATWSDLIQRAERAAGVASDYARQECLLMMRTAARLQPQ